jgi:hypothetical protein
MRSCVVSLQGEIIIIIIIIISKLLPALYSSPSQYLGLGGTTVGRGPRPGVPIAGPNRSLGKVITT